MPRAIDENRRRKRRRRWVAGKGPPPSPDACYAFLGLRCTTAERSVIRQEAGRRRISVSEFLRSSALDAILSSGLSLPPS